MTKKNSDGVRRKFKSLSKLQQLEVLALAVTLKSLQIAFRQDQLSSFVRPDPTDREVR